MILPLICCDVKTKVAATASKVRSAFLRDADNLHRDLARVGACRRVDLAAQGGGLPDPVITPHRLTIRLCGFGQLRGRARSRTRVALAADRPTLQREGAVTRDPPPRGWLGQLRLGEAALPT